MSAPERMSQHLFLSLARRLCKLQDDCEKLQVDATPLESILVHAFQQVQWVAPEPRNRWEDGVKFKKEIPPPPKKVYPKPDNYTQNSYYSLNEHERVEAAKEDGKIEAIKLLRSRTGLGLKEAKELVESWRYDYLN